jgi:allantoicase
MIQTKVHFGAGLVLGIVVCAFFFQFFAPRYGVVKSDTGVVKQDKWTGNSWHYDGYSWKEIREDKQDWEAVDDALMDALNIKDSRTQSGNSLNARIQMLKAKYPVLASLSDEDVMERIKYLYARKIMVDLYLSQMEVGEK